MHHSRGRERFPRSILKIRRFSIPIYTRPRVGRRDRRKGGVRLPSDEPQREAPRPWGVSLGLPERECAGCFRVENYRLEYTQAPTVERQRLALRPERFDIAQDPPVRQSRAAIDQREIRGD